MTQQISTLLELRNKLKDKKPEFIRQDYQRRKRLGRKLKWRKPKGIHSKIRHHFKGRRKMPSSGYKSPKKVKNLHSSGLKIINVSSVDDIKEIKKENEGAVISKTIGMKKRLEILKKAKELDVLILNLNLDEQIKKIEDIVNSKKKEVKKAKKEDKKEKEQKEDKDSKIQASKPEFLSDNEKKELDKTEKDRLLIKKI
ncbi:50S ribosomal protein L32e [Candidatus Woesearchaeota archaeon]|nr:50S ribosomal protein L32e [Candidatus Woesearchaeota archaeon]